MGNVQVQGFMLGECGCAMSMDVLWPHYGLGLDIGHRHIQQCIDEPMMLQQSHYFLVKTGKTAKHKFGDRGKPKGKQDKTTKAEEMDEGKWKKAPSRRPNPPRAKRLKLDPDKPTKGKRKKSEYWFWGYCNGVLLLNALYISNLIIVLQK